MTDLISRHVYRALSLQVQLMLELDLIGLYPHGNYLIVLAD